MYSSSSLTHTSSDNSLKNPFADKAAAESFKSLQPSPKTQQVVAHNKPYGSNLMISHTETYNYQNSSCDADDDMDCSEVADERIYTF